jgi:hypothetical protein
MSYALSPARHPSNRRPGLVLLAAALLLAAPAAAPGGEAGAGEARERANQLLLEAVPETISGLLEAVASGDEGEKTRLAAGLSARLGALEREIRGLPRATLAEDGAAAWQLSSLAPGLSAGHAAAAVRETPGWRDRVAALRENAVGPLAFRREGSGAFRLAYYPPADRLLAVSRLPYTPREAEPSARGDDGGVDRRRQALEAAWAAGTAVPVPDGETAGPGSGASAFTFLDAGRVRPGETRAPGSLTEEVALQLGYIVNVKVEGPPLLAATRANLFFDGEFGFMAWGGRWPELGDQVFMLRYHPRREAFLVRLEGLAAVMGRVPASP